MVFRLPPLNTLRIFDAAARRVGFTLAAEELHLTPSAVSHGIRTLELWLGTELFRREGRSLALDFRRGELRAARRPGFGAAGGSHRSAPGTQSDRIAVREQRAALRQTLAAASPGGIHEAISRYPHHDRHVRRTRRRSKR